MTKQIIIDVKSTLAPDSKYTLAAEEYALLFHWKIRDGEAFSFVDKNGICYRARYLGEKNNCHSIQIIEEFMHPVESGISITLLQSLPAKERVELIIEKVVELGVKRIIIFKSEKSISIEERDKRQKKSHNWPKIVLKAAKQCRRTLIPELEYVSDFYNALKQVEDSTAKIILSESEGESFKKTMNKFRDHKNISIMIGPEGGFSKSEKQNALKAGFIPVKAGERILRTETAAIAAVSVIQYELGDLG